jgi:hypothetical protein
MLKLGNGNKSLWKPAFEELECLGPRLAFQENRSFPTTRT